jgi:hypothetical protein
MPSQFPAVKLVNRDPCLSTASYNRRGEVQPRPTDDARERRCGSRLAAGFVSSAGALGLLYKSDRYYLPPGRCVSKHSIRARRRLLTRERAVNAYPPLMLGNCPATPVCLIVWCKECQDQVEPDPAEMAARVRRRNARGRLARAASLLHVREPADRNGCHRQ